MTSMEDFLEYVYRFRSSIKELVVHRDFFALIDRHFYETRNTLIFQYDPNKDPREIRVFGVLVRRETK